MIPKKIIVAGVVLAAALAGGIVIRQQVKNGNTTELTLYGNVDIREVQLGFRVGGRIAEMKFEEGNRVVAGDLLASLDARPYQDAVQAAEAQVAQQSAALAKMKAGPRKGEIAQARAQLAERDADVVNAQKAFERVKKLRSTDVASQSSLDQSQAALDMALARKNSAAQAARLLEDGYRQEDIDAAQAALQVAEANLAQQKTALEDTNLLAPDAGVILSRVRETGAIAGAGETVYVLSLDQPVWVRAYIGEPNLGKIHPGQEVEVSTDANPTPYKGHIGFISPVAEFTPKSVETPELRSDLVYRFRVVVDGDAKGLRQGMPVTIRIPLTTP